MTTEPASLSPSQQWSLVLLRTLVGWHFLYEGFVKLWLPAWSRDGAPLAAWSSAGYLKSATGPLGCLFHGLADSSSLSLLDRALALALFLVGLSLLLGLFTRAGAWGALVLLALFYLAHIPTARRPAAGDGRGLPAREQEPHRGGGGRGRPRLPRPSASPASTFCGARRRRRGGRGCRRGRHEPHPGAAGARPSELPEGAGGHARPGRPRRGGRDQGPGARRPGDGWGSSAWAARGGTRCSKNVDPAFARGARALRHQPRPARHRRTRSSPRPSCRPPNTTTTGRRCCRRRTSRRSSWPRRSGSTPT